VRQTDRNREKQRDFGQELAWFVADLRGGGERGDRERGGVAERKGGGEKEIWSTLKIWLGLWLM